MVIFLLALGPKLLIDGKQVITLPWGYIWSLPLLDSAESQRLMDFGQLVLALLLALWLAHVTKSKVALAARWAWQRCRSRRSSRMCPRSPRW